MTDVDYITLMENYSVKGMYLYYPQLIDMDINNNVTTLPAANANPEYNSGLRWSGTTDFETIRFILFDNGNNKAIGGTAITVPAQILWLKNTINRHESESSWTIDGAEFSETPCIIHRIRAKRDADRPKIGECTITFEICTPA